MTREEVQKLLGGYATGTLTAEEQQALFTAALDDQELFDALANEQSLRDLLRDPAAKAQMLAALDGPPARAGWLSWMRRPWVAGLAMAGVAAVSIIVWKGQRTAEPQPDIIARVQPSSPPPTEPVTPARQPEVRRETPRHPSEKAAAPAPPAKPPSSRDNKDTAADAVASAPAAAESQPKEQLNAAQAKPVIQFGAQNTYQNAQINVQNGAPSPMAQNAINLPQQQSFRQDDSKIALSAPNVMFDRAVAAGGGGRKKNEAPEPALKFTILRDDLREVDAATPLTAGEAVKLRIVPNADGFLYVTEGGKPLANAQVKAHQPFETPELKSDAAGQRQLRVILSNTPMAAGIAGALEATAASAEANKRATLARMAPPPQPIEQFVVITWR